MKTVFTSILSGWVCLVLAQSPVRTGRDYAIFFYVSDFQPGWQSLPETAKEATELKTELEANFGFTCEMLANPTKQQVREKIRTYNARLTPKDQVLFFFSMHGHYTATGDRGYLIGKDGLARDEYGDTWYSYDELRSDLGPCKAKHVLLALDACHSGSFGIRNKGIPDRAVYEQGEDCQTKVAKTMRFTGRQYCTSGNKNAKTPAQSLFAVRLLEALRKGGEGGVLRFDDLEYWIGKVETPKPESGSFGAHEAGGDFVFVRKNACQPNQTSDRPSDSDGDGVPDYKDKCPFIPSNWPDGCPDEDVDSDRDGIADNIDGCPEVWGTLDNSGCPIGGMILVLGGIFEMGNDQGNVEEKPSHKVTLNNFYASTTETSVKEYLEFARATGKNFPEWMVPGSEYNLDNNPYYNVLEVNLENHPIVGISWFDAVAYCNWRSQKENLQIVYTVTGQNVQANWKANGYRLPTESEWEFMARSRGKNTPKHETPLSATTVFDPEGLLPINEGTQNELGLYHLLDNVTEFCWDWLDTEYYLKSQNSRNPVGPLYGSFKTIRGGYATSRYSMNPNAKYNYTGFRIVRNSN